MNYRVLVIGYGNELRSDDGVGPRVARAIAARKLREVEAICSHQLLPEMAELVAGARAVIFIDAAAVAEDSVAVRPLDVATEEAALGHTSDPSWLLALTQALSGRVPLAWLVTVSAPNLDFGESLSASAERGAAEADRLVLRLLTEELRCTRSD